MLNLKLVLIKAQSRGRRAHKEAAKNEIEEESSNGRGGNARGLFCKFHVELDDLMSALMCPQLPQRRSNKIDVTEKLKTWTAKLRVEIWKIKPHNTK